MEKTKENLTKLLIAMRDEASKNVEKYENEENSLIKECCERQRFIDFNRIIRILNSDTVFNQFCDEYLKEDK